MPKRRTFLLTLFALVLFCSGAVWHLRVGAFSPSTSIYGDEGDGLFNLWVLEHVYQNAPKGWENLSDGRILYPEPNTYWASDNLLVPALLYALPRALGADPFTAYMLTVLALAALGFAATWALFAELRQNIASRAWTDLLPPLFAYAACFSQAQLRKYMHFQNLSAVFWICLLLALLRFLRTNATRDLLGMAAALVMLMASAPYYALLGICLCVVGFFALFANRHNHPLPSLARRLPLALPFAIAFLLLATHYVSSEARQIPLDSLRRGSLRWEHFSTPLSGWIRNLAPFGDWPRLHPGGYPGTGLLIAALLGTAGWLYAGRKQLREPRLWIPVLVFLLTFVKAREIQPFAGWILLGLLASALLYLLATKKPSRAQISMGVLAGAALLVLGTAMGPGRLFSETHFEPNVWGLFSRLLPGYSSMRELIRFAPMAHLLLLALVFCAALRISASRSGTVLLILLLGLQLSEFVGARAFVTRFDPAHLRLSESENAFFAPLEGVMFVVPAAPFHRNTQHMLRWRSCENLRMINGYSGHSTPGVEALIALENEHGRASPAQIAAARAQGADFLCVMRAYVPNPAEEGVRRSFPALFENERFLVVDLRAHAQAGDGEIVADGVFGTNPRVGGGDAPRGLSVGLPAPGEPENP